MTDRQILVVARALGIVDGYEDGQRFGCGLSWEDNLDADEAYGEGVNLGQALAAEEGR